MKFDVMIFVLILVRKTIPLVYIVVMVHRVIKSLLMTKTILFVMKDNV
ncbi:unnamed protein product [Schistosoma curassoni]|uniref:Uncharacterized protein n=1 Tax=Schistosoma curassoni TaxID=6186 RepID=A0A183JJV8_9TREM|nr:unnamed protein product [Schistosoma curassoni]